MTVRTGPPSKFPRRTDILDILVVGPFPPPIGGVSAHVARAVPLLLKHGFSVEVLSHSAKHREVPYVRDGLHRNPLRYFLRLLHARAHIVHYHHSTRGTLIATAAALAWQRSTTRVITLHSPTVLRGVYGRSRVLRTLVRWGLRQFDEIIVVTPEIESSLRPHLPRHRVTVIPAYLPASVSDERIPDRVADFLSRGRVFVAAAGRLRFLPDGRDLYGLDLVTAAFANVARIDKSSRLLLLVGDPPGRHGRRYLESLCLTLDTAGLSDRYMLYQGAELAAVLTGDVVLVRPTRSDGDAVSIREALRYSRPVITTDVATRPVGVRLVMPDDVIALAAAMDDVFKHEPFKDHAGMEAQDAEVPQHLEALLNVYLRHLPEGKRRR